MRISRTLSGRLCVVLSKEERAALPGPYRLVLSDDGQQLVLYSSPNGIAASARSGSAAGDWGLDVTGDAAERLPAFGVVEVKPLIGTGKMVAMVPPRDQLPPPPKARQGSGPARAPRPKVQPPQPQHARLPLGELVQELNARRAASAENMVFSVDSQGYLEVMVKYGRDA